MSSKKPLSAEQLERYRDQLRELRDRLLGTVDEGVDSIREEISPSGNLSNAPVHLADAASGQLDADIHVVESEWDMLEEVQAALHRLDDHTFGKCVDCGKPIPLGRLEVIPYAARCVPCASNPAGDDRGGHDAAASHDIEIMRLTGFEAIEFAEREGRRLNKAGDSIDGPAHGLTIAEAEAIASDDPDLIWLEIAREEYDVRKNMRPGR